MAKKSKLRDPASKRQLAALATLLGLMQAATKLSRELEELGGGIGGSLDQIVEAAGIPFEAVHNSYVRSKRVKKTKRKVTT